LHATVKLTNEKIALDFTDGASKFWR